MLALLEFSPLIAFGVAYWLGGIYTATAVLMVAMVVALLLGWWIKGTVSSVNMVSTVLVLVFGSATLLLRNAHFLQWKPSVFLWLLALALLVSAFVGKQPLMQRMLHGVVGETPITRADWLKVNAASVLFCVLAGTANILIAYRAPEATWVRFKVIGLPVAMFLCLFLQAWWLQKRRPATAP